MEPPFWFTGLQHPELELMLYGKNLDKLITVRSDSIHITKIYKPGNSRYLFLTIDTQNLKPGSYAMKLVFPGKVIDLSYDFHPAKHRPAGFSSEDVIYLIMPDRFANGNPENDNVPGMYEKVNRHNPDGRHGGDLEGIIKHLDYLQELGVTALWLTPVLEDNEPVYSYHHYAISNLYKIDPRFGTNEDYKRLANQLHKRNMKLIMDYVINHWGSKNPLVTDPPENNWIHTWSGDENGFKRSNYRMATQFDPYVSNEDKKQALNGWFDVSMPDVNLDNLRVFNYTWQNAVWWIEYAGLDGLRIDTYAYNAKNAINRWVKKIREEYPSINIVGEIWMHDQAQIAYWQEGSAVGKIQGFTSYLPAVMDFTLYDAVKIMFKENLQGWDKGMVRAYNNFVNDFLYPNPGNIMVFLGNHDVSRFAGIYKGDIRTYRLALTLILTTRGIPQLYYGDELGMQGLKENGDGDIRRDFPGGWKTDTRNAFHPKGRNAYQRKYYDFTHLLLQWRKNKRVIHHGKMKHFVPENNVYVYFRYDDKEIVMVILNNSPETQKINGNRFREILPNHAKGKEIITGKIVDLDNPEIPAKTPMIIEIQ